MRARIQKISKYAPSVFQGKLDFASARRGLSLTAEHPVEPVLFRALLGIVVALACAYVYFVGATILNVIARKEALAQTASLTSSVSGLEREYFAAAQNIGPEDGARLGLSPVSDALYLHRPGNLSAGAPAQAGTAAPESNEI